MNANTGRQKLRAAIVGIGHQALEDHIPAIKNSDCAELVAICDINKEIADDMGKKLNVKAYNDIDSLINSEKLDFIIITAPHCAHKEIIEKASQKGIHILKEKPFTTSLAEAFYIKDLSERRNIKIMTTLQRRFNPIYNSFFQLIEQIGTPFLIDIKYALYVPNPHEGWRGNKKEAGGGCILDMGYHMIDLLIWYFGLPSEVHAEISCSAKPDYQYDAEDTANIAFRYDNQIHGTIRLSRFYAPKEEYFKVVGTKGVVEIQRGKITRYDCEGKEIESLTRNNAWPSASSKQIDYFCKVIRGQKPNMGDPNYHLKHMAFVEACYLSAIERKYIKTKEVLGKWIKN